MRRHCSGGAGLNEWTCPATCLSTCLPKSNPHSPCNTLCFNQRRNVFCRFLGTKHMSITRFHLIWLASFRLFVAVLVGCAFISYLEDSIWGFIIAIVAAFLTPHITFYLLCRTLCPKVRSHIITDQSSNGQYSTQYRGTGNFELDKYIARYFKARQMSMIIIPPLLLIFLIMLVARVATW